jgi:hypothetical protein
MRILALFFALAQTSILIRLNNKVIRTVVFNSDIRISIMYGRKNIKNNAI